MRKKNGAEVLKLFEQLKKSLKVNKDSNEYKNATEAERSVMIDKLRRGLYDGLIEDLEANGGSELVHVILGEKHREGFKEEEVEMQKAEL